MPIIMIGPGGLFHSLRIAPEIVKICDEIVKVCPDAFVFNYSNPMQRVCHSVTTKYPDLKFTGLCHEIASMERQLLGYEIILLDHHSLPLFV